MKDCIKNANRRKLSPQQEISFFDKLIFLSAPFMRYKTSGVEA